MKRLALLAVTAFLAVMLSACGDNAEKKMEEGAPTATEQPKDTQAAAPESTSAGSEAAAPAPAAEEPKAAE